MLQQHQLLQSLATMMFMILLLLTPKSAQSSRLRKEIRNMTAAEVDSYFEAIWIYKNEGRKDGRDYMVTYDEIVAQHAIATKNSTVDQAHQYAAFVVWHTLIVLEFEIALQSINPNVTVPYWDWTIDAELDDPTESIIFTDAYFGNSMGYEDNYIVNTSLMAYFPVNDDPMNISGVDWESKSGFLRSESNYNPSPYVTRFKGRGNLPSTGTFNNCLNQENYSAFWPCIWGTAGSGTQQSEIHAGVHEWSGGEWVATVALDDSDKSQGDVLDFETSPNDPLWFSHHANLDRLRYYWQERTGDSLATDEDPCGNYYGGVTVYPQPPGHNLWNTFTPPFYAFRSIEEIATLGGLNISQSCYYLHSTRVPYSYPPYDGDSDDDAAALESTYSPSEAPSTAITVKPSASKSVTSTVVVGIAIACFVVGVLLTLFLLSVVYPASGASAMLPSANEFNEDSSVPDPTAGATAGAAAATATAAAASVGGARLPGDGLTGGTGTAGTRTGVPNYGGAQHGEEGEYEDEATESTPLTEQAR